MPQVPKIKPLDQDTFVTGAELADLLSSQGSTVGRWRDKGMPFHEAVDGTITYPRSNCIRWYVDQQVKQAVSRDTPDDLDDAKARKETASANLLELKLAELQGQLVTLDYAQSLMNNYLTAISAVLTSAEGKHVGRFVELNTEIDAQEQLTMMFREIRTEIDMNLGVGKSAEYTFSNRR